MLQKLNVILISHLYIFLSHTPEGMRCQDSMYKGFYKLGNSKTQEQVVGLKETQAIVIEYPTEADVIAISRMRYTSYCYEGGAWDSRTGCSKKTISMNPDTISKLERWEKEGICPIGNVCKPDGECWGSEALRCMDNNDEITKIGPEVLKWVGQDYKLSLYHACISSWSCTLRKKKVGLSLQRKIGKPSLYFMTPNKNVIEVPKEKTTKAIGKDGNFDFFTNEVWRIIAKVNVNVTCLNSGADNIRCIVKEGNRYSGTTFEISWKTLDGINMNKMLHILEPIEVINKGKKARITKKDFEINNINRATIEEYSGQKALSIEAAQANIDSISMIQMQSLYNIELLQEKIKYVNSALNIIVRVVNNIDDRVIGKIINKKVTTKWVNSDRFVMKDMSMNQIVTEKENKHCIGDQIYHNGVYSNKTVKDNCYPDLEAENTIYLVPEFNTFVEIVKEIDLEPSSTDSHSWKWMVDMERKQNDPSNQNNVVTKEEARTIAQEMYENLFSGLKNWFNLLSNIVVWVLVVIVLILLKKNR